MNHQEDENGPPRQRFLKPIPIEEIAADVGLPRTAVQHVLQSDTPVFHTFVPARGHRTRSAPYALRAIRDEIAVLDWEPSVAGALAASLLNQY